PSNGAGSAVACAVDHDAPSSVEKCATDPEGTVTFGILSHDARSAPVESVCAEFAVIPSSVTVNRDALPSDWPFAREPCARSSRKSASEKLLSGCATRTSSAQPLVQ